MEHNELQFDIHVSYTLECGPDIHRAESKQKPHTHTHMHNTLNNRFYGGGGIAKSQNMALISTNTTRNVPFSLIFDIP